MVDFCTALMVLEHFNKPSTYFEKHKAWARFQLRKNPVTLSARLENWRNLANSNKKIILIMLVGHDINKLFHAFFAELENERIQTSGVVGRISGLEVQQFAVNMKNW